MRPTPPATLAGWFAAGLALGWLARLLGERFLGVAPIVTWASVGALAAVAAVVGWTAWATHRLVQVERRRLEPHQAVNRLLLARAAALVGALVAGGYLAYALTWLGDSSALAGQRLWRGGAAAVLGVLTTVAALLLERACRVRSDDPET